MGSDRLRGWFLAAVLAGVPVASTAGGYIFNSNNYIHHPHPNLGCRLSTPTVTGISPNQGPGYPAPGFANTPTTVTITGTCLGAATAVNVVNAAGVSQSSEIFNVVSPSQIKALLPAGTGTVHVTVTTNSGTSAESSSDVFNYYQSVGTVSATGPVFLHDICGEINGQATVPDNKLPAGCNGSGNGNGFDIADNNAGQASPPKIYVYEPSITLSMPIRFIDDTSVAMNVLGNSGYLTVPGFAKQVVEGNHVHYTLDIQTWQDNSSADGTSCPSVPVTPDPNSQYVIDMSQQSPDGQSGCWVDLQQPGNQTDAYEAGAGADLYGPSASGPGVASASQAPAGGAVFGDVVVPVQLNQPSTYLRALVTVWEGDTRDSPGLTYIGWNPGQVSAADGHEELSCVRGSRGPEGWCPKSGKWFRSIYYSVVHQAPGGLKYVDALSAVQVIVLPAALVQFHVLPYTIVYQPPGDLSTATFSTAASYGTSLTIGAGTQVNNSTTNDFKQSTSMNISGAFKGFGFNFGATQSWDQSTEFGTGLSQNSSAQTSSQFTQGHTWTMQANPSLTPGSQGSYWHEPFWDDEFVLLMNPQMGLWEFNGQLQAAMLGADGSVNAPIYSEPTLRELFACAMQQGAYAQGYPLIDSTPQNPDYLNSDECWALMQLDPFWWEGQQMPGWTPQMQGNPRAHPDGGTQYGVPPSDQASGDQSHPAAGLDQVITFTLANSLTGTSTYDSTVTDTVGSNFSAGMSLKKYIGIGVSTNQGNSTATSTGLSIAFNDTKTTTSSVSTSITGTLDDAHGLQGDKGTTFSGFLGYKPQVYVYLDKIFGSYMFQDPTARCPDENATGGCIPGRPPWPTVVGAPCHMVSSMDCQGWLQHWVKTAPIPPDFWHPVRLRPRQGLPDRLEQRRPPADLWNR